MIIIMPDFMDIDIKNDFVDQFSLKFSFRVFSKKYSKIGSHGLWMTPNDVGNN